MYKLRRHFQSQVRDEKIYSVPPVAPPPLFPLLNTLLRNVAALMAEQGRDYL